jgi:hypothetical protein
MQRTVPIGAAVKVELLVEVASAIGAPAAWLHSAKAKH